MLTTRWQPADMWTEVSRLHDEMNRLFGRQGRENGRTFATSYPAINVWEDKDRLFVEAELPGFELADLEVSVEAGNQLSLKGQRKLPEVGEGVWHRRERGFGEFTRTFALPSDVDPNRVEATFKNGVLLIQLPKSEAVKPRRIEVKSE